MGKMNNVFVKERESVMISHLEASWREIRS